MSNLQIFSDFHHIQLWRSLEMLFEGRFGCKLFSPIGLDWFDEGYWAIARPYQNSMSTIGQYLGTKGQEPDNEGIYHMDGIKGITLDQFKSMDIDIVIASIPDHVSLYAELIRKYKPKAKLIYQIGNHFGDIPKEAKNIMASTSRIGVPTGLNVIFYHQEFPLNIFNYEPPTPSRYIRSFTHTLATADHLKPDWEAFLGLEAAMPEYKFESYGASCRDGCISRQEDMARLMKDSLFGFNLKTGGDGYGHVVHNFFAVGRPPIVKIKQYEGKLASELMQDGVTCIDITNESIQGAVEKIKKYSGEQEKMCGQAYKRFKEVVSFDREVLEIQKFLGGLV